MDAKSCMPRVESSLRHQILKMPEATYEASGIVAVFAPNGARDFCPEDAKTGPGTVSTTIPKPIFSDFTVF